MNTPLAASLRPTKLDDVIGQEHLTEPNKPLRLMVQKNFISSSILWGPPGVGKTSIIKALSCETNSNYKELNATNATIKDIRSVISQAEKLSKDSIRTIVFIDEIHRFNKAIQDVLLPVVENGIITIFGATTEQPKFAVNSTLLSRCLVFELKPLDTISLVKLALKVIKHYQNIKKIVNINKETLIYLANKVSGDGRKLITALETIIEILSDDGNITTSHIDVAIPDKHIVFDSTGKDHFDLAHCYQEAIQNSDVNAAIYFLAKWLESGEDPAYICRRMLITAFEDCAGNPLAMTTAMAACYTVEKTGLPECMIPMAQATCEMAMSKRNKAAFYAIHEAIADVRNGVTVHIPPHLRAGTKGYESIINKEYVKGWERDNI